MTLGQKGIELSELRKGDRFSTGYAAEEGIVWEVTETGPHLIVRDVANHKRIRTFYKRWEAGYTYLSGPSGPPICFEEW